MENDRTGCIIIIIYNNNNNYYYYYYCYYYCYYYYYYYYYYHYYYDYFLQDLFDDLITKIGEPLRDMGLTKREVSIVFCALIASFPALPQLTEKVADTR